MHILTLPHFLGEVQNFDKHFLMFFTTKLATTSLFEGFKQKEISFNVTLIINTFLSVTVTGLEPRTT